MATSVGRSVAGRRGVNQSDGRSIGRLVESVRRSVGPTITHCPQLTIRYSYPRYPLVEPLSNTSFSCSYPRSLSFLPSLLTSFLHLPRLLLARYPRHTTSRSIRCTIPIVQLLITHCPSPLFTPQYPITTTHHLLSTTHTLHLPKHHAPPTTHNLLRRVHYLPPPFKKESLRSVPSCLPLPGRGVSSSGKPSGSKKFF